MYIINILIVDELSLEDNLGNGMITIEKSDESLARVSRPEYKDRLFKAK